jgi:DNA-binding IclR family transcriptional regulator
LAQLNQIRELGYSTDVSEFKEGVACVSGPALHEGTVVGAFTLSSPVERFRRRRGQLVEAVVSITGSAAAGRVSTRPRSKRTTKSSPTHRAVPVKKENDER